jgi:hypothetical protein
MMPHHRHMIRSQCRVIESSGAGVSGFALTLRFSQLPDGASPGQLVRMLRDLPAQRGIVGAHMLHTQTPAVAQTTEQKIRGSDAVADWIVLATGYDATLLEAVARSFPAARADLFRLSHTMTPADL